MIILDTLYNVVVTVIGLEDDELEVSLTQTYVFRELKKGDFEKEYDTMIKDFRRYSSKEGCYSSVIKTYVSHIGTEQFSVDIFSDLKEIFNQKVPF